MGLWGVVPVAGVVSSAGAGAGGVPGFSVPAAGLVPAGTGTGEDPSTLTGGTRLSETGTDIFRAAVGTRGGQVRSTGSATQERTSFTLLQV